MIAGEIICMVGFKAMEWQLGIPRRLTEISGYQAVRLWWQYVNDLTNVLLAPCLGIINRMYCV